MLCIERFSSNLSIRRENLRIQSGDISGKWKINHVCLPLTVQNSPLLWHYLLCLLLCFDADIGNIRQPTTHSYIFHLTSPRFVCFWLWWLFNPSSLSLHQKGCYLPVPKFRFLDLRNQPLSFLRPQVPPMWWHRGVKGGFHQFEIEVIAMLRVSKDKSQAQGPSKSNNMPSIFSQFECACILRSWCPGN